MQAIIGGLRYDTEKAVLIAHDRYWDGQNWDRHGRNDYLYKTARGNFFVHHTTMWEGERDTIRPVSPEEAKGLYESLPVHELEYEEAFGVVPEEA